MGNRAVITTQQAWMCKENNLGIYLHWNGGRDSVEAFLTYCKMKGYRSPESDTYGWAALVTVISNFFGAEGMSIDIDIVSRLDTTNTDNGVYIIKNWKVTERIRYNGNDYERIPIYAIDQDIPSEEELTKRLLAIDKAMPEGAQLGEDFFTAIVIPTEEVEIGDTVFMEEIGGSYKKYEVVGFGEDEWVNGHKANGVPYVNRYMNEGVYTKNPNNYIWGSTVRVIKATKKTEVE